MFESNTVIYISRKELNDLQIQSFPRILLEFIQPSDPVIPESYPEDISPIPRIQLVAINCYTL